MEDIDIGKRQSAAGAGLNRAQKDKIVEVHNNYRKGEGSSNMQQIVSLIYTFEDGFIGLYQ